MAEMLRLPCIAGIIIMEMICAGEMSAQYVNAYQEGTVWELDGLSDADPGIAIAGRYFFDGEIFLNGLRYLKLYRESWRVSSPEAIAKSYSGGIRYEEGRVFYLPPEYDRDFLIFDFNLREGDEISLYPGEWGYYDGKIPKEISVRCVSEDVRPEFGKDCRVLGIKEVMDGYDLGVNEWIVGVGTNSGPLCNLYTGLGGNSLSLYKVTVDGEVLFNTVSEIESVTKAECKCCSDR